MVCPLSLVIGDSQYPYRSGDHQGTGEGPAWSPVSRRFLNMFPKSLLSCLFHRHTNSTHANLKPSSPSSHPAHRLDDPHWGPCAAFLLPTPRPSSMAVSLIPRAIFSFGRLLQNVLQRVCFLIFLTVRSSCVGASPPVCPFSVPHSKGVTSFLLPLLTALGPLLLGGGGRRTLPGASAYSWLTI